MPAVKPSRIFNFMYIEKESYEHKLAKDLLTMWLKEEEQDKFDGIYCFFCGLKWRKSAGVFPELPFYETSSTWYFECSGGLTEESYPNRHDYSKHHAEGFDKGKILFKPDITIFQQGRATVMIEVVHKSPVSDHKLQVMKEFFKNTDAELYTINSRSVIMNYAKPTWLNFQKLF